MLLNCGFGKQPPQWHVLETKAPMYARVYLVQGGTTVYQSETFCQKLQRNWLYIFPSFVPYEMTTSPEDPLECLFMHLDLHTISLTRPVAVDLEQDRELEHYFQVIFDGIRAGYPAGYLEQLAKGFEMLCVAKGLFELPDRQTGLYLDVMRKTYRTDTTVQQIADSLGYSKEYFIRNFKKHLGVSPHQYAISLRMSDAVRMLSGDMTLEAIAHTVGYVDDHSFSNAFRQYYGISPGTYRKHYAGSI